MRTALATTPEKNLSHSSTVKDVATPVSALAQIGPTLPTCERRDFNSRFGRSEYLIVHGMSYHPATSLFFRALENLRSS
jgi:hypothetical protein